MISLDGFARWLAQDISINTELQKIILKKIVEYMQLNTKDGKIVKPKKINKNIVS